MKTQSVKSDFDKLSRGVVNPAFFTVALMMEPPTKTHHRKLLGRNFRNGKANMRDDPALKSAIADLTLHLLRARNKPRKPLKGPIAIGYEFYFCGNANKFHTEKPDHDNLVKTLQDALVKADYILDDKTICRAVITKDVVSGPGFIRIRGRELLPTEDLVEVRIGDEDLQKYFCWHMGVGSL